MLSNWTERRNGKNTPAKLEAAIRKGCLNCCKIAITLIDSSGAALTALTA
jgi:hypothetical protein